MGGFTDVVDDKEMDKVYDVLRLEELITENVIKVLKELGIEDPIMDMMLISDGMLDNMDLVYIILEVENYLGVKFEINTNAEAKELMEDITLNKFLKILYRNVKEN